MMKEYTYRESYATFLLIGDQFPISKTIRELSVFEGMDTMFDDCMYIAKRFAEYDTQYSDTYSLYESFEKFLAEYEEEIMDFLIHGTAFEIPYYSLEELSVKALDNALSNMRLQLLCDNNEITTIEEITLDRIIAEIDSANLAFTKTGEIVMR